MDGRESQEARPAGEAGALHRTTEQGDELTEQHSMAQRQSREQQPYMPPRQPAQDPPAG